MPHLFISDVHLGAFDRETNRALEHELIRLIDYCDRKGVQIHILGDLFDYWMEYPGFVPGLGRDVLNRFESYNRKHGRKTLYITGNHDCWTLNHFEDMGFETVAEIAELNLGAKKVLLCHGDGIKDDKFGLPRPLLHRLLRNRIFIRVFQSIFPNEKGLRVMKSFSDFTRKDEHFDTVRLSNWAKQILASEAFDAVITGHDHVARVETFSKGLYINSGAFFRDKTLASYNNDQFELVVWDDDGQTLKPYCSKPKP